MLTFLKLGWSLITDKNQPYTPRLEIISSLAKEIASALREQTELQLVLGHGSGSFGHQAASLHRTRDGVEGKEAWQGFGEVWFQASSLNRLVVEALRNEGMPVVTISPFSCVTARGGRVVDWNISPIINSLEHQLVPIIHGDVIFDKVLGGTILSTEELFLHLGEKMKPRRILLAGREAGVWKDFPQRESMLEVMTPGEFQKHISSLRESKSVDITGGMQTKVSAMLRLVKLVPGLEVRIFSGEQSGNVQRALRGESLGTMIHA